MPSPIVSQPSFLPSRKWTIGTSVFFSIVALLAIVVMVNYLGARHFRRFQWASRPHYPLSPQTLRVLSALTNKVNVIVLFNRSERNYASVIELLQQYKLRSPQLDVQVVDYGLNPGRAALIEAQYHFSIAQGGDRVIFASGVKTNMVYARDLSIFDARGALQGRPVRRVAFKGEQLFTSALYSLLDTKPIHAYFLIGHGEHDADSQDDHTGYSEFARILEENNVDWRHLDLSSQDEVPADCQLLIIAGPASPFSDPELAKLQQYLLQGGRLLALIGHRSWNQPRSIEKLLAHWGVDIGYNYVTDVALSKSGDNLIVSHFGAHPSVDTLQQLRVALLVARSVGKRSVGGQNPDAPTVTELAFTSALGFTNRNEKSKPEGPGTIPVMAAVEKGTVQGITAERGATRIVVVGSAVFLANEYIDIEANRDFARNAVNWLLNREMLLESIGPRPVKAYRLSIPRAQMKAMRWVLLGALPGAFLFLGLLVALRRRS